MRIVILGAGGMLGHKMYSVLSREFPETTAVFRKCPAHYANFHGLYNERSMRGAFDARKVDELDTYLSPLKPDVVINCIGLTTRKLGEQKESDIVVVNSVLPHKLKEWCQANGSRFIHFSTDCVFSGKSGPYNFDHPRDAKDFYGQSKALGEVEGKGVLTVRSSIIGLEIEGKTELLEWFLAQRGKELQGFSNVMYSGVTTTTMAHVVRDLLKKRTEFAGIQQLASAPISKFELLKLANEIFGVGAKIKAIDQPASNKVLIQSKFFNENGIRPPSWRSQLEILAGESAQYERWLAHVKTRKAS
jgi:dTDP-4-dehydrorhamnose reductase